MELKKSKKANLEDRKNLFFLLGLVIALGTTLVAFEWTTKPAKVDSLGSLQSQDIEEQFIPVTREKELTPPPPPPPPKVVEVLNIVEDDVTIIDELELDDTDANDETIIDVLPVFETEEEEDDLPPNGIYNFVQEPAEFPGGTRALYSFINKNVRYPVIAQENGVQGKVFVKFVVNEQGKVSNAEILRGADVALNNEALRVINSLPDFKPGKQSGRAVKVYYHASINFTLQ